MLPINGGEPSTIHGALKVSGRGSSSDSNSDRCGESLARCRIGAVDLGNRLHDHSKRLC